MHVSSRVGKGRYRIGVAAHCGAEATAVRNLVELRLTRSWRRMSECVWKW